MHYFEPVTILNRYLPPMIARHDFQIALHGDPIRRKLQPFEQGGQGQPLGNLAPFTIELDRDQKT